MAEKFFETLGVEPSISVPCLKMYTSTRRSTRYCSLRNASSTLFFMVKEIGTDI